MTIARLRPLAFAVAFSVAAPSITATAFADEPTREAQKEAGTRFKKGLDLFKDGDYQAALIEFRRAYEIAPNYNVLYNIGQVYFQLQDYANALTSLERYLAEGGAGVPAGRRADVQRDIDKLRARVSHLVIAVDTADAEITIDDVLVGKSPLPGPLLVSAGRHKLTVSRSGRVSVTRIVEIASDETQTVKVELSPEPVPEAPNPPSTPAPTAAVTASTAPIAPPVSPPPRPRPAPPPPSPKKKSYVGVAVGWALAGGFTGGAIAAGVAALGASSGLAALRKSPNATRTSLDAQASTTKSLAVLSDTMSAGALVSAGVAIYFMVVTADGAPDKGDKGDKNKDDKDALARTLRVGLVPGFRQPCEAGGGGPLSHATFTLGGAF